MATSLQKPAPSDGSSLFTPMAFRLPWSHFCNQSQSCICLPWDSDVIQTSAKMQSSQPHRVPLPIQTPELRCRVLSHTRFLSSSRPQSSDAKFLATLGSSPHPDPRAQMPSFQPHQVPLPIQTPELNQHQDLKGSPARTEPRTCLW